jgi:hypothetical protein
VGFGTNRVEQDLQKYEVAEMLADLPAWDTTHTSQSESEQPYNLVLRISHIWWITYEELHAITDKE